jgi:hypothetical protein
LSNGFIVTVSYEVFKGAAVSFQFEWEGKELDEVFDRIDTIFTRYADWMDKRDKEAGRSRWRKWWRKKEILNV